MSEIERAARPDPRTGVRPLRIDGGPWVHYLPADARPPKTIPEGMILVHNFPPTEGGGRVNVTKRMGVDGFRFWYQEPGPDPERCGCGWGSVHYAAGG
jgi:hypothetical protein